LVTLIRQLVGWLIVMAAIAAVWATGVFDGPLHLYSLGLNADDCFRDVNGAVACGTQKARVGCEEHERHRFEVAETTCYAGRLP
jgi:hypothetical protein